jgi:cell division protein FtsL
MTNHGGCAILNEMITYPDRKETRKKFQKTGMPWWSNEKANLLLVPIFSAMDGTVLYSIMEECFLQSALMSIVMAFGVAVVLNILPLVIAKFLHGAIYKTTKHGLTMFAVFVAGFLLVYGGTVYLRFAYSDMYEQENQSMTLENTVSEEKVENGTENVQEISEKRRKSMAVVTLLSISPLITSLLGFAIAYVSDDEIRRKVVSPFFTGT